MSHAEMLVLILLIDAALGEPDVIWGRVPHPIVLLGRLIGLCDMRANHGKNRQAKGIAVMAALVLAAIIAGNIVAWLPDYGVLEIIGGVVLMAHRSLVDHVRGVARALGVSVDAGRAAVAKIVGRDVRRLDESGVSRAAIESASENFSDGVIAPAFWFLLFGLPGILAYKLINTADSMIGHLDERYSAFGWAAARLDDAVNWIPARISGALICASGNTRAAWDVMRHDADLHRSPNAGWPEAAMAGSLDIALGGPRDYDGVAQPLPWLNSFGRRVLVAADIGAALARLWRAWGIMLAVCVILSLFS